MARPRFLRRHLPDAELLELLAAGDERAVRELHDRFRAPLVRYASSLLGWSAQDAEDVVQDTFVRALEVIADGFRPRELTPWLYRLVRNRAIDEVRRARRRDTSFEAEGDGARWQAPAEQDPSSVAGRRESLRELVVDLAALPEAQREALLARVVDGDSPQESAERLGVSVAATQMLVVRGRANLQRARDARAASGDADLQLRALAPPAGLLGALGFTNLLGFGGAKVATAVVAVASVAVAGSFQVVRHERAGAGDPAPFTLTGAGYILGHHVVRGQTIPDGTAVAATTVRFAAGDHRGKHRAVTLQCPKGMRYAAQLSHHFDRSPVRYAGPPYWQQPRADGRVTFRFAGRRLDHPANVRVRVLCRTPGEGGSLLAHPRLPKAGEGHGKVCSKWPYVYRDPEHLFVGTVFRGQKVTVTRRAGRSAYVITDDGVRGWIKTKDLCPGWTAASPR